MFFGEVFFGLFYVMFLGIHLWIFPVCLVQFPPHSIRISMQNHQKWNQVTVLASAFKFPPEEETSEVSKAILSNKTNSSNLLSVSSENSCFLIIYFRTDPGVSSSEWLLNRAVIRRDMGQQWHCQRPSVGAYVLCVIVITLLQETEAERKRVPMN